MIKKVIILLLITSSLNAQTVVQGTVTDAKTNEALPFANVYFNNSTKGAQTDDKGNYIINNVAAGSGQLVVSYLGYTSFQQNLVLQNGKSQIINVQLTALTNLLNDVEVKARRDKVWERHYNRFEEQFLGDSPNYSKCKVLNGWVVDFNEKKDEGILAAKSNRPIEVENLALGYKIFYDLWQFSISKTQFKVLGAARFEELKPKDEKERKRWINNRLETFERSSRFFFRSLFDNKLENDQFLVYKMDRNTDWWGTNVWDKNKSFYTANNLINNNLVIMRTSLSATEKLLITDLPIEVSNERLYVNLPSQNVRDAHPVTKMRFARPVVVNKNGLITDPSAIEMIGYWASERIADMLPIDYNPEK